VPEIVLNDQRPVGPSAENRSIEVEGIENGRNIIGPQFGVAVRVARLLQKTMTSHIHRDEAMVTRQVRVQLPAPGQRALRESVDEQNGTASRIAGFDDVQLDPSATCNSVRFHGVLLPLQSGCKSRRP
jgi:hypothetical protein